MTKRLFDEDAYQQFFEAIVQKKEVVDGRMHLVLDQTLFYPASGGQPCDTGMIALFRIEDVFEEAGEIIHVTGLTECHEKIQVNQSVSGCIDMQRRYDHQQQHTGQHILSHAFWKKAGAETIGFHLGQDVVTIDLDMGFRDQEVVEAVAWLANEICQKNLKVHSEYYDAESVKKMPLRKKTDLQENIRVVIIDGIDYSACCGTHVRTTGEIGLIKILKIENYKIGARVSFVCGRRALLSLQNTVNACRDLSQLLTAGETDLPDRVRRLLDENKRLRKENKAMTARWIGNRAADLSQQSVLYGNVRFLVFEEVPENGHLMQPLVRKLIASPGFFVLAACLKSDWQMCMGRSKDVDVDVRPLMQFFCDGLMNGKGGGSPSLAMGRGRAHHTLIADRFNEIRMKAAEILAQNGINR